MLDLIGTYECKLDTKNRLAVPSGLLKQLPPDNEGRFVLNRGFEINLMLYPAAKWERIRAEIEKLNRFDPEVRQFVRNFYRYANLLKLDSNNRLLLPKTLLEYAGIKDELLISCTGPEIEIWNPDQYDNEIALPPQDFAQLAKKLLVPHDGG
ncbi:MAG: division/cell wall cluster transcriptional repressor MraZ [Candidatus Competibacteraceae bacterium]|nr:division/cell wall cluster transcriptional repressor MraZ [Candidatus Competibacteraceae bacterium]MCB1812935.1 division/cell wall cluster transcriptional repressor MraZ [Candidatus Competibacteraceae bacterium]